MSMLKQIALAIIGCLLLLPSASAGELKKPQFDWKDLAIWHGKKASNQDFVKFVRERHLEQTRDNKCGLVFDKERTFWMNIRNDRIVRVSVRLAPSLPKNGMFKGALLRDISRHDQPDDVIRKMGPPAHDVVRNSGSRYLVYGPRLAGL